MFNIAQVDGPPADAVENSAGDLEPLLPRKTVRFGEALIRAIRHSTRLTLQLLDPFGPKDHVREKLVAEMGSKLLCVALGIAGKITAGRLPTTCRHSRRAVNT